MAKFVLISGICLFAIATQATTYNDRPLLRVVRTPHYGGHIHYNQPPPPFPPPPPPPFFYRTHNWSGVGRNNEGAVEGVFSGAAATAQSAIPASNTAFSVAASAAGESVPDQFNVQSANSDDNFSSGGYKNYGHYNSKSSDTQRLESGSVDHSKKLGDGNSDGYSGLNRHTTHDESSSFSGQLNENSATSNGYGQGPNRNYGQTSSSNLGNTGTSGGYGGGYKNNLKASRYSTQNGEENQFGSQQSGVGRNEEKFEDERQFYSGGYDRSRAQSSSSNNSGHLANSQGTAQSVSNGYGYGNNNRRSENRGYENEHGISESFKTQQLQSTASSEQSAGYNGSINGTGHSQDHSALHGALELVSQGLQAAKNSECSTCQKSTYALSNAMSQTGSAIALSIGG